MGRLPYTLETLQALCSPHRSLAERESPTHGKPGPGEVYSPQRAGAAFLWVFQGKETGHTMLTKYFQLLTTKNGHFYVLPCKQLL